MRIATPLCIMAAVLFSTTAQADAGFFIGGSYSFGGAGFGVTAKILSSDKEDQPVIGAGVTYYPMAINHFGADLSVGYNLDNAGLMLGYDFLQKGVSVGVGYVNTEDDNNQNTSATTMPAVAPPPPPPPPPPPGGGGAPG